MRLVGDIDTLINPLPREGIFAEGNMENHFLYDSDQHHYKTKHCGKCIHWCKLLSRGD